MRSRGWGGNPHREGVCVDRYVEALLEDLLRNNADGSAFILRALPTRTLSPPPAGTVESMLAAMAHAALGEMLRKKAEEQLEPTINFQAFHTMEQFRKSIRPMTQNRDMGTPESRAGAVRDQWSSGGGGGRCSSRRAV